MLRLFITSKTEVDPRVLEYEKYARAWDEEIAQALGREYQGLIAFPQSEGESVYFFTPKAGEITPLDEENREQYLNELDAFNRSCENIHDFLNSQRKLINPELESSRSAFDYIVGHCDRHFVHNGNSIIGLPLRLSKTPLWEERARLMQAAAAPAAVPPAKKRGCLIPFLALLALLLLLLALLWWFLLRPWPMEGTLKDRLDELLGRKPDVVAVLPPEKSEERAAMEQAKLLANEEYKLELAKAEEEARLKAEEEARLKAEEEARLKAEEEARLKAEEEARLKAEEEARLKAEAEAKLKAQKEAELKAKKEAQEKAKKEALAKKAASEKSSGSKKIPKCKTLKEEGKMPQMAIAFDGSESMLMDYGRATRLDAAKNAATSLVNSIDKNVSIGLVEINGCGSAKNRGFYEPSKRAALVGSINAVNPYRYDGKTPLVDGLYKLSRMLDGVNSEAVGILISDGEDTCPLTYRTNLCAVAAAIHRNQPKLKIHTILIGDAIDSAACIARNTGGKVFKPRDAAQIKEQLKQAGATLKKVCEE